MRCIAFIFCILCASPPSLPAAPPPARPVQTMDQSRQLLVQGGDFRQRAAVLRFVSELRETVLKSLFLSQESYPVARPIIFDLNPALSPEAASDFQVIEDPAGVKLRVRMPPLETESSAQSEQTVAGIKLNVLMPLPEKDVSPQTERTILSALLTEIALRKQTPAERGLAETSGAVPAPPRWLVDALLHKHHHPDPLLSPVRLRPVFETGKIPSLHLLLARPETDLGASSEEEVALARCLLWMLSSPSENRAALAQLLKVDFTQEPLHQLLKLFPSLGQNEADLLKGWTLAIAAYGTQEEILILDSSQTQIEIEHLLNLNLTESSTGRHVTYRLEQFSDFVRLPGVHRILMTRQLEWIALQERCHFLYGSVIAVYAQICSDLARGKTAGIAERLRTATLERESLAARLSRIHDYMNWYEAVAGPRQNATKLRQFYRILEEQPPVSARVLHALDQAEARLKAESELEDIQRLLQEVRERKKDAAK